MDAFLSRFGSLVTSVLSGFDRVVFRGTLIPLMRPKAMHAFLRRADVRFLDFPRYAQRITEQLTGSRVHSRRVCKLSSTWAREEHLAKELGTQIQNQGSLNPLREP